MRSSLGFQECQHGQYVIPAKRALLMAVSTAMPVPSPRTPIHHLCQDYHYHKQYQRYCYSFDIIISSTASIAYYF